MPSNPTQTSDSSSTPIAIAARNFLLGSVLSGVPVLAYLWLSVEMTYGSWSAVGPGTWGVAIAMPLLGGLLSARFGPRGIRLLSHLLESANLPF